jgi:hypothetical protein
MKRLLPLLATLPVAFSSPLPSKTIMEATQKIDQVHLQGLKELQLTANPIVDDAVFLRRSYLNIIGRLPTEKEARQFLDSNDQKKRSVLIDTLVDSPGMKSRLFNFWSDLLRVKTNEESSGLGWHVWLRNAVENNMPYNEMVHAMLGAEGHIADNPAVGYYLRDRGMLLDNVSNTVEVFLGQQIGCAQCHDHPFDDTTQMEYYQLAAFLGGTEYRFDQGREKIREVIGASAMGSEAAQRLARMDPKKAKKIRETLKKKQRDKFNEARDLSTVLRYHNRNALTDVASKDLKLPADYAYEDGKPGDVVSPNALFGNELGEVAPEDRRKTFAKWATSPENPFFTKVIANRLWKYTFGYGLVANPSDWGNSPEPSHPKLVDTIEKAMIDVDYDVQEFLRILFHTQLFQREVTAEEPAQGFSFPFQGPILRRLDAEELRDSFVTMSFGNIDDSRNYALERSWNEYARSYEFVMETTPSQFRKIDELLDEAEIRRRQIQKETSELRTKMQEARREGNLALIGKLARQLREVQKKSNNRRDYLGGDSELAMKAQAAVSRRTPSGRPDQPEFRLRASELPAPQRGGSFVAEFGGSDRNSPSSAHTTATVPQSLRLLNGNETSLLTSKKNSIAKTLNQLETPEERLDYLYLTFYSAYPTEEEKEAFLPDVSTLASTETFARAILTSNRFLFVQ